MFYHKHEGCAFIFWADYYDDLMTALFAVSLRRAGWRTRLIGLVGDTHAGRNGLRIVADVPMTEVMRRQEPIACVIAPCAPEQLAAQYDERIDEFLDRARQQQAVFVSKARLPGKFNTHWPEDGHTVNSDPEEVLSLLHLVLGQLEKIH
jgi:hypothetical protein